MKSLYATALILVTVAVLLAARPHEPRRDYSRAMVHVLYGPFHCPPRKQQAEGMPRTHMAYPDMWLGTDESGEGIKRLHQYRLPPNPYNGRSVNPEAYPTTVIYSRGDDGRYRERFRMTGWQSDGDREILEALIRRAA